MVEVVNGTSYRYLLMLYNTTTFLSTGFVISSSFTETVQIPAIDRTAFIHLAQNKSPTMPYFVTLNQFLNPMVITYTGEWKKKNTKTPNMEMVERLNVLFRTMVSNARAIYKSGIHTDEDLASALEEEDNPDFIRRINTSYSLISDYQKKLFVDKPEFNLLMGTPYMDRNIAAYQIIRKFLTSFNTIMYGKVGVGASKLTNLDIRDEDLKNMEF